ncbi:MAG: hypothetical protein JW774_05790, partial [Candidatus Aureabacteria bacterium]|nr:hypothetical protein [Candidatus Auribacterota bacterium]
TGISFGIIGKAGYDKWGAWDLVFSENFWSTFVIRIFGVIASPVGGTFFLLGVILGAVLKGFCSKKYFLYSWLISFMLYYMLVGEGNRVLEYYQLFLVPVAGIFIAQSVLFFEAKISADSRKTASIFTLLVYLMIFFTGFFYVSKHYDYDPYTEQAYLFAPEVQKQTERDSLFIVVDMPRVYERKWLEEMEARIHRPSFLCFIDRHGWEFLPHELNQMPVEEFESLIKKGAKYLLLPRYWFQVSVGLRQYLENKPFPVVTENSQFILFRLN